MNRSRLGAVVLAALLVLGLLGSHRMSRCQTHIAAEVDRAAEAAAREDWHRAETLARSARSRWQKTQALAATLWDQTPLEEIDTLFALLEGDRASFRENCIRLSRALTDLADSQKLSWSNLL